MPATQIDRKKIEGWLREIGCDPKLTSEPAAAWRFNFQFPVVLPQPNEMSVMNLLKPSRALIVTTGMALATEHHAKFGDLDEDAKQDFLRDLHGTLINREHMEFMLHGLHEQVVTCPTMIQVWSTIYDDGLSLDNLYSKLMGVWKTQLATIACVQRHIVPTGAPGSGQFDFKRLGGLQ